MKLPISVIEYGLKQRFTLSEVKKGEDTLYYSSPFLYDGDSMEAGRVYVLPAAELLENDFDMSVLAICSMSEKHDVSEKYRGSVIYTDCESVNMLFNEVQKIFDRYQDWENKMNEILTEGKNTVQRLLDLAVGIHQNMFLLQDASFRNISIAYTGSNDGEHRWNVSRLVASLGKQMDEVSMERIRDYFPARRQIRKVMYHAISEYETLDMPLYDGSVYIGMLSMLSYNRKFEKQDYYIVELLSRYISYALSREVAVPEENIGKLSSAFTALLDSKHISKRELAQICSTVGFGENDMYVIAAIQFTTDEEAEYARYLQQIIKTNIEGSVECVKNNIMAVAINVSMYPEDNEDWTHIMDRHIREFGLRAGISDCFIGFRYCELYFAEAVHTLSLIPWGSAAGMYFFKEFKISYALHNCAGKLKPEMLYTDGFKRLLQYEKNTAVSYIETLRVYLEENLNSSRAAKRLYISRNTFLARYERLCAVLQEDLSDPDVRFGVELSLRLYAIGK